MNDGTSENCRLRRFELSAVCEDAVGRHLVRACRAFVAPVCAFVGEVGCRHVRGQITRRCGACGEFRNRRERVNRTQQQPWIYAQVKARRHLPPRRPQPPAVQAVFGCDVGSRNSDAGVTSRVRSVAAEKKGKVRERLAEFYGGVGDGSKRVWTENKHESKLVLFLLKTASKYRDDQRP